MDCFISQEITLFILLVLPGTRPYYSVLSLEPSFLSILLRTQRTGRVWGKEPPCDPMQPIPLLKEQREGVQRYSIGLTLNYVLEGSVLLYTPHTLLHLLLFPTRRELCVNLQTIWLQKAMNPQQYVLLQFTFTERCARYYGKQFTHAVCFTPHKSLVRYRYCYYPYFINEETDIGRLIVGSDAQVVRKDVGFKPISITQKPTWSITPSCAVCLSSVRIFSLGRLGGSDG